MGCTAVGYIAVNVLVCVASQNHIQNVFAASFSVMDIIECAVNCMPFVFI